MLLVVFASVFVTAPAHPGRLDKNGGHNVNTEGWGYPLGSYHYHRGSDRDTAYDKDGKIIPKNNATPMPEPAPTPVLTPEEETKSISNGTPTMETPKNIGKYYDEFPTVPNYGYTANAVPFNVYTENGVYVYQYIKGSDNLYGIDLISEEFYNTYTSANLSIFLNGRILVYIHKGDKAFSIVIGDISKQNDFANILESASKNKIISVIINGEAVKFDQPPEMINDRVMVPIRYVVEKLDCVVEWDGGTQTVYINEQNVPVRKTAIKTENINVYVNNERIIFNDQQPVILNGRTLIPVREVMERLGCDVMWEPAVKTIYITN